MINMAVFYSQVGPVSIFLIVTFIAFRLMVNSSRNLFLLTAVLYLLLSYIVLFIFSDFFNSLLERNGISIHYSHNDIVLIFDILIICILISIANIAVALIRRRKKLRSL
jgi:hypothetical protein